MDPLLRRTARAGGDTRPPGACLDAETLAAWADGGLPAAQRALVEAHVADCDRCLAMAGAMATTSPPAPVERPTWSPIRWLVPLTTAAVAVTAWLVVRPAEPPTISTAPASDAAEMAKPADPPPAAESEIRERAESRRADQPASQRKAAPPPADPTAPPTAAAVPPAQPVPELKDERQQAFARSAQLSGVVPEVMWTVRLSPAGSSARVQVKTPPSISQSFRDTRVTLPSPMVASAAKVAVKAPSLPSTNDSTSSARAVSIST